MGTRTLKDIVEDLCDIVADIAAEVAAAPEGREPKWVERLGEKAKELCRQVRDLEPAP